MHGPNVEDIDCTWQVCFSVNVAAMVVENINGIDVVFPFEPYEIQKDHMSKVIECLSTGRNGILESPTGTGKTLSLLCSTLAWLETVKAQYDLPRTIDDFTGKRSFLRVPKIIYASRTHSQLTQAMGAMKMTSYNHMKSCVIGSREYMCINADVIKKTNHQIKNIICNNKIKNNGCDYLKNLQKIEDSEIRNLNIVDIEELVSMGKSHSFCPYFMAKKLKRDADIIFMPHNLVLVPRLRKSLGIELKNSIIILDEAHNVENICEDAASTQLKSTDIAGTIEYIAVMMSMPFDDNEQPRYFSRDDLIMLEQILLNLKKEIDAIVPSKDPKGTTFPGNFIFMLLDKAGITSENHQIITVLLEKLSACSKESTELIHGRINSLHIIHDALTTIFMGNSAQFDERVVKCFKVHVVDVWIRNEVSCRVLNYWCFNPAVAMKMLLDEGVRCCILAGSTLTPLRLELMNPVHVEIPHFVKDSRHCVRILSRGFDGEILTSAYKNRNNEKYLRSLGLTIIHMTEHIPNGLLIFFPSYLFMNTCMKYWQKQGIWNGIYGRKPIYTESKDKDAFSKAMNEYKNKIRDTGANGAIFMAVCRGNISEGLDFADEYCRGVIIVGLPFPPFNDPRINLKMNYLDNCSSTDQEMGGNEWYILEAYKTVHRAVGRVIRHWNDYGAILLLDERFMNQNRNIPSQLSLWLWERVKIGENFGEITRDLELFYKNAAEQGDSGGDRQILGEVYTSQGSFETMFGLWFGAFIESLQGDLSDSTDFFLFITLFRLSCNEGPTAGPSSHSFKEEGHIPCE